MGLAVDYDSLRREVGTYLGMDPTPGNWSASEGEQVADILRSGLRRFYWPFYQPPAKFAGQATTPESYVWSFLQPIGTLALVADTGTYLLPADFNGNISDMTFETGSGIGKVARVSDEQIRMLYAKELREESPKYYAIRPLKPEANAPTQWEVVLYPIPSGSTHTLTYRYQVDPPELGPDNPYPLGGPRHSETVREAVLSAAEKKLNDEDGLHSKAFAELLAASIQIDRELIEDTGDPWPLEADGIGVSVTGLAITKSYLLRLIGRELGYGPHPSTWSHHESQAANVVLTTGLRNWYNPSPLPGERYGHDWSFLQPLNQIKLADGVHTYDLPDEFASMSGPVTFVPDGETYFTTIHEVSEFQLRSKQAAYTSSGRPTLFAIRPKSLAKFGGTTRHEITFWPTPDDDYQISYRCRLVPATLDADMASPYGGHFHAQTIIEACLAAAEQFNGKLGLHSELFREKLAMSVAHDRKIGSPETLGTLRDPSDRPLDHWDHHGCDQYVTTYNGVEY